MLSLLLLNFSLPLSQTPAPTPIASSRPVETEWMDLEKAVVIPYDESRARKTESRASFARIIYGRTMQSLRDWRKSARQAISERPIALLATSLLIVCAIVAAGVSAITLSADNARNVRISSDEDLARSVIENLRSVATSSLTPSEVMVALIQQEPTYSNFSVLFPSIAAELFKRPSFSSKAIRNLQVAPSGIIELVYPPPPPTGSTPIGHNLLNDTNRRADVLTTLQLKSMYLSGPYVLVQGGIGLIARVPIYIPNVPWANLGIPQPTNLPPELFFDTPTNASFWGLAIILLDWTFMLDNDMFGFSALTRAGLRYTLTRPGVPSGMPLWNGNALIASSAGEQNRSAQHFRSLPVLMPNVVWELHIRANDGWYVPWEVPMDVVVCFLAILIGLLFFNGQMNAHLRSTLLARMLPERAIKALSGGDQCFAESFENVLILFCDVAATTTAVASASTPGANGNGHTTSVNGGGANGEAANGGAAPSNGTGETNGSATNPVVPTCEYCF